MISQNDYILNLLDMLKQLEMAQQWMFRSFQQCEKIGISAGYKPEQFDHFENLCNRFRRASDILIQKVFRSIDQLEFTEGGSLIDALNRAQKRGLIDSLDQIRNIR